MFRKISLISTMVLLTGGILPGVGCASQSQVNCLDHRVDRLEDRVDNLNDKCCGKEKCEHNSGHSNGLCAQTRVNTGTTVSSGGGCELPIANEQIDHTFRSRVMVQVRESGNGQFSYIDPMTGKECMLENVPTNFVGGEYPLDVVFRYRTNITVVVTPVSTSGS